MLRALGVLFIVCCCFFLAVAGIGVTLLAYHYGNHLLPSLAVEQDSTTSGMQSEALSRVADPPPLRSISEAEQRRMTASLIPTRDAGGSTIRLVNDTKGLIVSLVDGVEPSKEVKLANCRQVKFHISGTTHENQNPKLRLTRLKERDLSEDTDEVIRPESPITVGENEQDHTATVEIRRTGTYVAEVTYEDDSGVEHRGSPVTFKISPSKTDPPIPVVDSIDQSLASAGQVYRTSLEERTETILLKHPRLVLLVEEPTGGSPKPWLLRTTEGKVLFRDQNGNEQRFGLDSTPAEIDASKLASGLNRLVVMDEFTGMRSRPFQVIVPSIGSPPKPAVLQTANGEYANAMIKTTGIALFGDYFRVSGTNLADGASLSFLVYGRADSNEPFQQLPDAVVVDVKSENRNWTAVLKLPDLSQVNDCRLFVVSKSNSSQSFSDPVEFLYHGIDATAASPTGLAVEGVPLIEADRATASRFFLNKERISVTGNFDLESSIAAANTQVLIYDAEDRLLAKAPLVPEGGTKSAKWTVEVTGLPDGESVLRARFARGASRGPLSAPITVVKRIAGPQVEAVIPPNFGTAPGVQQLRIQFSPANRLVPANAGNKRNYVLLGSNSTGRFDLGTERVIVPVTADFDSSSNTVTLNFRTDNAAALLTPDLYQLRINAHPYNEASYLFTAGTVESKDTAAFGIKDIFGNALEGLRGKPKTDHVVTLTKPESKEDGAAASGRLSSTEIAGIPESGGPYISYPEYTKYREIPAGFNPSDKVISRVVRLYYFRDAHRVTQIINRKAKSYNRQAVEMDAQLADAAGRAADAKTDLRRSTELKAVRAAKEARAAEEALQQHQTSLIAARSRLEIAKQKEFGFQNDLQNIEAQIANVTPPPTEPAEPAQANGENAADNGAPALDLSQLQQRKRLIEQSLAAATIEKSNADGNVTLQEQRVNALLGEVQAKRHEEITATEAWEDAERQEQRAYEERFRREVAAKTADPDTYAPGVPTSDDPVAQVSISVIGEGLIQLRGPRKGVNIVHTMINQMDSPVGQVRVSIHTIQINGEHGDRMEKVAMRIQRYLDHSRFLTTQSAEMLRKAVAQVASRTAEQCYIECPPGCSPEMRDLKYREAFFGSDFIQELLEMDSEFLHSGNKVLSLHSMDTTSLSSALFLLALAKNDIRQQILSEFMMMVQTQLPIDEQEYFLASNAEYRFRHQKFQFLAHNARFVSFRGFFDLQVNDPNTMTPMQREFIRLAQIFKSRLVTEIELRQRVMERALIETRVGSDYLNMLKDAETKEREAKENLERAESKVRMQQELLLSEFSRLRGEVKRLIQPPVVEQYLSPQILGAIRALDPGASEKDKAEAAIPFIEFDQVNDKEGNRVGTIEVPFAGSDVILEITLPKGETQDLKEWSACIKSVVGANPANAEILRARITEAWNTRFFATVQASHELAAFLAQFNLDADSQAILNNEVKYLNDLEKTAAGDPNPWNVRNLYIMSILPINLGSVRSHVVVTANDYLRRAAAIAKSLADVRGIEESYARWSELRAEVMGELRAPALQGKFEEPFERIEEGFSALALLEAEFLSAQNAAQEARRPLDHKKFLDMLIDDVEEKFIELVEGTRAQTSNIDNYLARLATALEDDFNTQFYAPVFRYIRETSYYYDVQLGQIQTESILTNNRMFAQVSPQATMEFDLPKRNILINEAFESALAAYNDYGALVGDPNFIALAQLYGGQPTAATYLGGGPAPPIRDVLPGLPSRTDEELLSQSDSNLPKVGSNLEALIPDPAVYKFETGTGFSIKPVIQPDGQAVVFHLNYLYTTNVREPVRADEKHLGRVKRHFIDTDVVTGNYELREVSRFQVGLKASRTSRGVPLLEDIPVAGWLFRPLPSDESALQMNLIYAQSVIYPTLFDLMGLRWAPAVSDLDPISLQEQEFVYRNREKILRNEVFDYASHQVDDFMRVPPAERRGDLYRTQEEIPFNHPNGYIGPGLNIRRGASVDQTTSSPTTYGSPDLPNYDGTDIGARVHPKFEDGRPDRTLSYPGVSIPHAPRTSLKNRTPEDAWRMPNGHQEVAPPSVKQESSPSLPAPQPISEINRLPPDPHKFDGKGNTGSPDSHDVSSRRAPVRDHQVAPASASTPEKKKSWFSRILGR